MYTARWLTVNLKKNYEACQNIFDQTGLCKKRSTHYYLQT